MRIADLSTTDFAGRIAGDGLAIRFGPFVCHLTLHIPGAAAPLHTLYGSFPLASAVEVVDAHVSALTTRSKRAPWRQPVHFYVNGHYHAIVNDPSIAVPSLEWTLNWSIATRANQYLLLHAGALDLDGSAMLMPAPPGSGKSTLTAGLVSRGWRLLTDEMTIIRDDRRIQPYPRPISLKEGAIEVIRAYAPELLLDTVFPGTFKGTIGYGVPPHTSVAAQDSPSTPRIIIFPQWRDGAGVSFERLRPLDAYFQLIVNSVNYELIGEPGVAMVNDLVQQCPAYLFEYGDLDEAGKALAERLH